jgi:hypothetical protein
VRGLHRQKLLPARVVALEAANSVSIAPKPLAPFGDSTSLQCDDLIERDGWIVAI